MKFFKSKTVDYIYHIEKMDRYYSKYSEYQKNKNRPRKATITNNWFQISGAHAEITKDVFDKLLIEWGYEKYIVNISIKSKMLKAF